MDLERLLVDMSFKLIIIAKQAVKNSFYVEIFCFMSFLWDRKICYNSIKEGKDEKKQLAAILTATVFLISKVLKLD